MIKHSDLITYLEYDSNTGRFNWIKSTSSKIKIGDEAGSYTSRGYHRVRILGNQYKEHRLVWFYIHGVWPSGVIDHINGVRDDNRISNLRDVTQEVNNLNKVEHRYIQYLQDLLVSNGIDHNSFEIFQKLGGDHERIK